MNTLFLLSGTTLIGTLLAAAANPADGEQSELSVDDFRFDGPLGCQGATIEKVARNHFKIALGHAPEHTDWSNMLQFQIKRNAKGNSLQLDVVFNGGDAFRFNSYSYSWSYNGKNWQPIHWQKNAKDSKEGDTLIFPVFTEDTVYFGHQVPMSYEDMVELIRNWEKSPYVKAHVLGQSLGHRDIYRLEITDPDSPYSENQRWVHYFANQHPGEHNSQWRMVGMIDWLLSEEAREARKGSICHFVIMMSPDAPSHGWYRVNAEGVDMNRSYKSDGSDPESQAHEAYICQKDLETLMASSAPVTDVWSMHTWGGIVEPICIPGPEMGTAVGPWTDLKDIIQRNDAKKLIKPLKTQDDLSRGVYWTDGPHQQFGVTAFLCEGAGSFYTREENLDSGEVLIKSIVEYYKGIK